MTSEARSERLLEIEQTLVDDENHVERDKVLQRLTEAAQQTKHRLDQGLSPDEADKSKRLLQALYCAHQVVRAVWRFHHAKSNIA